jgi:hypothetical protein
MEAVSFATLGGCLLYGPADRKSMKRIFYIESPPVFQTGQFQILKAVGEP